MKKLISLFSQYIRNIMFFLVFSAIVGIILPNQKYKSYIALILGFILIILIIEPIFLFSSQNMQDMVIKNEINFGEVMYTNQADDLLEAEYDLIASIYTEEINKQLNEIAYEQELEIVSSYIEFDQTTGQLTYVELVVRDIQSTKAKDNTEVTDISVEPIMVSLGSSNKNVENEQIEEDPKIKNLKNSISDFYNLSDENIYIKYYTKA